MIKYTITRKKKVLLIDQGVMEWLEAAENETNGRKLSEMVGSCQKWSEVCSTSVVEKTT